MRARAAGLSRGGAAAAGARTGHCVVRSRVRARLAVLSVLVGRLDCEEARGQEDEECGTHRDLAEAVTFIDELALLHLVCQRYTLFGHRYKNGAFSARSARLQLPGPGDFVGWLALASFCAER